MPAKGGAPAFDDTVAATAVGGDALTSTSRVRKSTEAAVRANIETFAQRLKAEWRGARQMG
jgi:hypothetical protein